MLPARLHGMMLRRTAARTRSSPDEGRVHVSLIEVGKTVMPNSAKPPILPQVSPWTASWRGWSEIAGLGAPAEADALLEKIDVWIDITGQSQTLSLLHRFSAELAGFITGPRDTWQAHEVRGLVGLAGLLGFARVERLWRAIETGGSPADIAEAQDAAGSAYNFVRRFVHGDAAV